MNEITSSGSGHFPLVKKSYIYIFRLTKSDNNIK